MEKLLVLLVENPDTTLAENTLSAELNSEPANKLSNYLTEMSISELYPAEQQYELAFGVYSEKDSEFINSKFGDFCRILSSPATTMGKFIQDIANKEKNAKHIIFLKSNVAGLLEEDINNFFSKLEENNIIFGQSGENSFYLLGLNTNIVDEIHNLEIVKESEIESISENNHLLIHHLPEKLAVENVEYLGILRDSISEKTSLATTIDRIVLKKDRLRHNDK